MAKIKMGLVQAPSAANRETNVEMLLRFAQQARKEGCCCICFPEAFLTGYAPAYSASQSISREDNLLNNVAEAAVRLGLDILVGFMEWDGEKYYLSMGIFLADGRRDFYRKTHLGEKERLYFTPGDVLPVYPLSCGITAGIQMCVEAHYPEITQTLSLKGAQVVFAPHAVPRAAGDRKKIWEIYIPCRSYDNRVLMACCNLWDEDRFSGGCLVTNEKGETIASCFEDAPALMTFEWDPDDLKKYREKNSSPRYRYYPDRRCPELYK